MGARKPLVGVMCCNEVAGRPIQSVATRFVQPLAELAQATVLLIPAVSAAVDARALAETLDGLLLTGSRSHIAPSRYGGLIESNSEPVDQQRDEVALSLAGTMIERGRPVFGICRGMQEINVLFGGTLSREACGERHMRGSWEDQTTIFEHRHEVKLIPGGLLATSIGRDRIKVTSVHEQGVARLGRGLTIEAIAPADGLVEAISVSGVLAPVLAVQWHPECDLAADGASFFTLFGASLRGARLPVPTAIVLR